MENDKKPQPSYFAVIPAEVRYSKELNGDAKLLYGEITALSNKHGYCFASNQYFADLYTVEIRSVQRWVAALQKNGFINVLVNGKNRRIYPIVASTQEVPPLGDTDAPVEEAAPAAKKGKKAAAPKKEKVSFKFTPEDMQLAEVLRERVIANFPHLASRKTTMESWANDMRLLREYLEKDKDARTPAAERITFMIMWVQGGQVVKNGRTAFNFPAHDFWAKNILSAAKLRAQWDEKLMPQLQVWMQTKVKKHGVADLSKPQGGTRQPQPVAQL